MVALGKAPVQPASTFEEAVIARLDEIDRRLAALAVPTLPGLTVTDFAKRIGRSRATVFRYLSEGTIAKKNGRIPQTELRKFCT